VLELGEDEGGAGDLGDVPRAGGDVLEEGPALGEQGEPSFSLEAQASEQGVRGAGVDVGLLVSGGALDGDVDADSGALVAGVGQRGHSEGRRAVQGGQGVGACGGDVVDVAGLGRAGPDGEAAGSMTAWTFPPGRWCLPEYQASISSPFTLVTCSASRSVLNSLPSRITKAAPSCRARSRASCRSGAWSARTPVPSPI
jgi:hypothetical protein